MKEVFFKRIFIDNGGMEIVCSLGEHQVTITIFPHRGVTMVVYKNEKTGKEITYFPWSDYERTLIWQTFVNGDIHSFEKLEEASTIHDLIRNELDNEIFTKSEFLSRVPDLIKYCLRYIFDGEKIDWEDVINKVKLAFVLHKNKKVTYRGVAFYWLKDGYILGIDYRNLKICYFFVGFRDYYTIGRMLDHPSMLSLKEFLTTHGEEINRILADVSEIDEKACKFLKKVVKIKEVLRW